MKKQYEKLKIEICSIEEQDIIMASSVFIEWDEDWWQDGSDYYFFE